MSDLTDSGGIVVAQGRFRVDRKRALEKMERFQLEDPHRYVLEWVAAAVVGGARRIDIYNDSDDFRISWTGDGPSGEELDGLFDHLWGNVESAHAAMLQHLGIGVLGALGLNPRWVYVDSRSEQGDLRLSVVDPLETRHVRLTTHEVDGVRCHVREQLTGRTVREALFAIFHQEPAEARLVQGAARWCPVPIWINGKKVDKPDLPPGVVLQSSFKEGLLWLAVGASPPVELLRHGLVVDHLPLKVGSFQVGGWWRSDEVRLNASRSQIVQDERFDAVQQALQSALDRLLQEELPAALAQSDDEELRWTGEGDRAALRFRATRRELLLKLAGEAMVRLAERKKPLGALETIEALTDASGHRWSLASLAALSKPYGIATRPYEDPELEYVIFTGEAARVLKCARPEVPDLTEQLEQRAEGRRRRAALAPEPSVFKGSVRQHVFQEGRLSGAIRLRRADEGRAGTIEISVRIGRLPLCTTEVEGPGGRLAAILDHPGFVADLAFREVIHDDTWQKAVAILRTEALHFLAQELPVLAESDERGALMLLTDLLGKASRKNDPLGDIPLDPRLRALAVVPTGQPGRRVSVDEIVSRGSERPWWVMSQLDPHCPEPLAQSVLLLPESLHRRWLRWLGPLGREGDKELSAQIERARRLAMPRREPVLQERCSAKIPVDWLGLRGEIGLAHPDGSVKEARIEVLREGVEVCTLRPKLAMPGVVAIVDKPSLEVTPAHDGLVRNQGAALVKQLGVYVDDLAVRVWSMLPKRGRLPLALMYWLAESHGHIASIPIEPGQTPLDQRPVAWRVDGQPVTLEMLRAHRRKKSAAKLRVLSEVPRELPGFEDALLRTPGLEHLLHATVNGKWRKADTEVEEAARQLEVYLRKPPWTEPRCLARMEVEGEDWSGVALLPEGEELGVLRVTVLWKGRVLTTAQHPSSMGPTLVVSGPLFSPTHTFSGVRESGAVTRMVDRAGQLFEPLLDQAIERARPGTLLPSAEHWLGLVVRLLDAADKPRKLLAGRLRTLPLARTLEGEVLSLDDIRERFDEKQPVFRVSAELPEGPADEALYLRDIPNLDQALRRVLGREVALGDEALLQWRAGQQRKARLRRQAPVVQSALPVLARAALPGGGEVALLVAGSGLTIQPLAEGGLPLDKVTLDCPVPAAAVLIGRGVEADRAFQRHVETASWRKRVEEVREILRKLVQERLRTCKSQRDKAWAWAWLLGMEGELEPVELEAEVFPLVDGTFVSLQALRERQRQDGALAVLSRPTPVPKGKQPVLVNAELRERLERHFTLIDLSDRWQIQTHRGLIPVAPPRRGCLSVGDGPITVAVGGMRVCDLQCPGPLPLWGTIEDDALKPDALWRTVEEDEAWRALLAYLTDLSRQLILQAQRAIEPDKLLNTLMSLTAGKAQILDGPTGDAVLEALKAAPLFQNSQGRRLSLNELLAHPEIRAVSPGTLGEARPGRPPFVWLAPAVRDWLKPLRKIRDSQAEIGAETLAVMRSRRPPWKKPEPPATARSWREQGVEGVLWLDPSRAPTLLMLLNEGRDFGRLTSPAPGATGWLDGPFEREALPAAVAERVEQEVGALLSAEASSPQGRGVTWERLKTALGRKSVQELLAERPCWRQVALFKDTQGGPVTLARLLAEVKERGHLLRDAPGTLPPRRALLLALEEADLEWLRALFPTIEVRWYSAMEAARAEKERTQKQKIALKKRRTQLLERLRALGVPGDLLSTLGAQAVDGWLAGHPDAPDTEPIELLAAWEIGSALLHEAGKPDEELALIEALAAQLG